MSEMGVEFGVVGDQSPNDESPTQPQPPDFELLEQLGHGATTTVYRARRTDTATDIAVKMLRERTTDTTQRAATYRREAALVARIKHPNVTAVHAAGHTNGRPWLALELVEGTSLAHHLKHGPLGLRLTS
jgi:serine/threonine protein kinase